MKDSENSSDAGSDENGRRQISRGEGEWRDILRRADRETARFLGFYEETFRAEQDAAGDRLDRCALAMGWHLGSPEDGEDDSGAATRGNAADFTCRNASPSARFFASRVPAGACFGKARTARNFPREPPPRFRRRSRPRSAT